jgi:hypothetical protein
LTTPIRPPRPDARPRGILPPSATTMSGRVRPLEIAGAAASRDATPRLRVTISLSVRVHCCGEKDSATTTLAWLTCLCDQPPDCQRATGRAPRIADRVAPGGSASHAPRLAAGQGAGPHPTGPAPPRTRRGRDERKKDRERNRSARRGDRWVPRPADRVDRSQSCPTDWCVNPRGKPAGWTGIRSKGTVPMRPRGMAGIG